MRTVPEISWPLALHGDLAEVRLTKCAYKPPTLCCYGTLRDITLTVGQHNREDQTPSCMTCHTSI
jgi:hypothetical protein